MLLPSFYLENFRLFDKLEVKRLGRVNLIVGRNNVGKSAFLEAVYIYAADANRSVLNELIQSRQESWDSGGQDNAKEIPLNFFRHFFKDHKLPSFNEAGFKLATTENAVPLHVKTAAYVTEQTDKGFIRRKLIDTEEIENLADELDIFVVAEQEKRTKLLNAKERNIGFNNRFSIDISDLFTIRIQLVPTQGISDREAAQLWDAVNLTDLADVVIDGLKLIEASLLGLAFVESDTHEERIPLVKLQDQEERVPLKSLGDGVTRVFHIMLALVNAKDGVLLIDEFENGLHWTVQESVWRVLFQMAARLNVQVFCTTHSRDCIMAFDTVWQDFEQEGAFLRLYAHNNEIRVREYDLETLSDSLETDVDVR